MIETLLRSQLRPILEAEVRLRKRRVCVIGFSIAATGYFILFAIAATNSWWSWPAVLAWTLLVTIGIMIARSKAKSPRDLRFAARQVEDAHPDLQAALLAAVDQQKEEGDQPTYLQQRLVDKIREHAEKHKWIESVSPTRSRLLGMGMIASLIALTTSLWFLLGRVPDSSDPTASHVASKDKDKFELSVTPGDVELEKGERLAIEATFFSPPPISATLVVTDEKEEKHFPMKPNLEGDAFSAVIPRVTHDSQYEIHFQENQSHAYSISVFEHPHLLQADALITPPAYLKTDPIKKTNTQKIVVMEGSQVEWSIRVNHPLRSAHFTSKDGDKHPFQETADDPTLLSVTLNPLKSQEYHLHLIDKSGRSNKKPPKFSIKVNKNAPPKLRFKTPGDDTEVTSVQELPIEGLAWDDVVIERVGFTYQIDGKDHEEVLSTEPLESGKKHTIATQLNFEALGLNTHELVTYHLWAEDRDPKGEIRRTKSDMFFANVRPFEHVYEEALPANVDGEDKCKKLLKHQKEIINASWKFYRGHELGQPFEKYQSDLELILKAQHIVAEMTKDVLATVENPALRAIYTDTHTLMVQAASEFSDAIQKRDGDLILPANTTARAAYAKLLEALSYHTRITKGKSKSTSTPKEAMNLELKQRNQKYAKTPQAQLEEEDEKQKENLAILNLVQDLARRLEAIQEKIKELTQRTATATAEERPKIERELKRLEEEQRQLLQDLDALAERMDTEENQTELAEEQKQLQQAREDIENLSEQLKNESLGDASSTASRAGENLKKIEDELQARTAKKFQDEMRALQQQVNELAEQQKQLGEKLTSSATPSNKPRAKRDKKADQVELAEQLINQAQDFNDLIDKTQSLSEQAEGSEPLLSSALYDAVRNAAMNRVEESLAEASTAVYQNRDTDALAPEKTASKGIAQLKQDIDEAAKKVLGNEAETLRYAKEQLDELIKASQEETHRLASNHQPSPSSERPNDQSDGNTPSQAQNADRNAPNHPDSQANQNGKGAPEQPNKSSNLANAPSEPSQGQEEARSNPQNQPSQGEGQSSPQTQANSPTQANSQGQGQSPSDSQAQANSQGQGQSPSDSQAEASSQGQGQSPSDSQAQANSQGQGQSPSDSQAQADAQGQPSQGQGQSPSDSQAQADAQGQPSQGQGQSPSDAQAQANSQGQSSQGQGQSPSDSQSQANSQGQPSQGQIQSSSDSQSQANSQGQPSQGQSQNPSNSQAQANSQGQPSQGQSQSPSDAQAQANSQAQANPKGTPSEEQSSSQANSKSPSGSSESGSEPSQSQNSMANHANQSNPQSANQSSGSQNSNPNKKRRLFFEQPDKNHNQAGIFGGDYHHFYRRIIDVKGALNLEPLQRSAERISDKARQLRFQSVRNNLPPQPKEIDQHITQPLIELRQRVNEEIAKLNRENPITPIDRDPVPSDYEDLVRRYYENLSAGN